MIDEIARASGAAVSRETVGLLERYVDALLSENTRQNLIGPASEEDVWARHIVDSAQLLRLAPRAGSWADIGSGAGLPGFVLGILSRQPITLIEPRRLRAEFLERTRSALKLANVTVLQSSAGAATGRFDYITARAVASSEALLAMTAHLAHPGTIFLLPRGRSAQSELDAVTRTWQGGFRLEQSLTSADAAILVASGVRRKGGR